MGLGIWSMHYVGMLAFSLPVPILYHYPTVILSLLASIGASAVALLTVSQKEMRRCTCLGGSIVMGGGIGAMHFLGMEAMRLPAMMHYSWDLAVIAIVLAIGTSLSALKLSFRSRQEAKASVRKVLSGLALGSAIPLTHYTGMWAVNFHRSDVPFSTEHAVRITTLSGIVISVTSLLILSLVIVGAFFDRIIAMQKALAKAARDGEARFRMLAEEIPQIVWTATPSGGVDYSNRRFTELTGMSMQKALGTGWGDALHPDDLPVALRNWEMALQSGQSYETEFRLRAKDGKYRWHLVRATPMSDSAGTVVQWFGACTDIECQMQNQQELEEEIKKHTAALLEANNHLESEMRERALAQQELNEQNERMLRELTRRSRRSTTLARMAELLQCCAHLKDVYSVVAGMAPQIFSEFRGAVLLFNSSKQSLETAVSWSDCELPAEVFEPEDCWALRTGHLHFVRRGDKTAECAHATSEKHSYMCLPLLSQGEAIGILHFQMKDASEPVESEKLLATTFAEQIGLSVANLRLREALRNQSIRDPLTALFNRRYMEEMMERETRRAVRAVHGLGVLMLDLDHFKNFNDTYGHEAGDTVLREVAAFLTKSVRAEDFVCRYGGEEFVVVLPMADLKASLARAERIRSRLREWTVLHQGQSLGVVTVSVGVAALPEHGISAKDLLASADAALYRAKRDGRDRVCVAESNLAADPPKPLAMEAAQGS